MGSGALQSPQIGGERGRPSPVSDDLNSFKNINMKKTFLIAILFVTSLAWNTGQVIAQVPVDSVEQAEAVATEVPEILWVVIDGDSVGIPTTDAKLAAETVKEIIRENKGNWPKSVLGWITLILGIIFSARGTVFITSGRKIYAFLKVFLRKTLNIVAFISGVASAGVTLLIGKGSFEWQMFSTIWGITAFLGVYIYETWIKKPDPVTVKNRASTPA